MAVTDKLFIVSPISLEETAQLFAGKLGHSIQIEQEKGPAKTFYKFTVITEGVLFLDSISNAYRKYLKERYDIEPTVEIELQYDREFGYEWAATHILQAVLQIISEDRVELLWEMYNGNEVALRYRQKQLELNPKVAFWTAERLKMVNQEYTENHFEEH